MRHICPKCGEIFTVLPPNGTCPVCDATVVIESEISDADHQREPEGLPSPKRRL